MYSLKYTRDYDGEKYSQCLDVFSQDLKIPKDTYQIIFRGMCKYPYGTNSNRWNTLAYFKKDNLTEKYVHKLLQTYQYSALPKYDDLYKELNSIIDELIIKYCEKYKLDESDYSSFGMETENDLDPKYKEEFGESGPLILFPIKCFVTYCDTQGRYFNVILEEK